MALTYKTSSLKKFLFIFLSCLLFQQLTAQTIVKFDNGNNIIYKNLQGKTIVKNKKYTIAFTDTISSIGFVGTRKGEIVCINNAGKELFEVYINPAKRNVLDLKNETCKNREKRNVLKISHTRHFKTTKKQSKTGCFYSF